MVSRKAVRFFFLRFLAASTSLRMLLTCEKTAPTSLAGLKSMKSVRKAE
jgi:hypothetical protein